MFPLEVIIVISSLALFSITFLLYERSHYPKKIKKIAVAIENKDYSQALNILSKIGIKLEYLTTIYLYYLDIYYHQENWHSALYYVYLIEKTDICQKQLEDEQEFLLKKIHILENVRRYEEAIQTYEKIMVANTDEKINFSYSLLLYNVHRYSEALENFKFCYSEGYRKQDSLGFIIKICFKSSLFKEGIEYYQENPQTVLKDTFIYGSLCFYFYGDYYQVNQNLKSLGNNIFDLNEIDNLHFHCLKVFNEYQLSDNKLLFHDKFKEIIHNLEKLKVEDIIDTEARYTYLDILLYQRDQMVIIFKQMQYIIKKNPSYRNITEIFKKFNKIIKNPFLKKIYINSDISYSIEELETVLITSGVKNFSSSVISDDLLLFTIRHNRVFSFVVYLGHTSIPKQQLDKLIDIVEGDKFYIYSIWNVPLNSDSLEYTDAKVVQVSEERFLSLENGVDIFGEI